MVRVSPHAIFLGLADDYKMEMPRFRATCIAYLMHSACNELRHGTGRSRRDRRGDTRETSRSPSSRRRRRPVGRCTRTLAFRNSFIHRARFHFQVFGARRARPAETDSRARSARSTPRYSFPPRTRDRVVARALEPLRELAKRARLLQRALERANRLLRRHPSPLAHDVAHRRGTLAHGRSRGRGVRRARGGRGDGRALVRAHRARGVRAPRRDRARQFASREGIEGIENVVVDDGARARHARSRARARSRAGSTTTREDAIRFLCSGICDRTFNTYVSVCETCVLLCNWMTYTVSMTSFVRMRFKRGDWINGGTRYRVVTRQNVLVVEITDSRVSRTSNPDDARADARTRARPRRTRLLHRIDRSRASIANGGARERENS